MPDLGGFVRNVESAPRNPAVTLDYGGWVLQWLVRTDGPIRRIGGVRLGSFNSFSEYYVDLPGAGVQHGEKRGRQH